MLAFLLGVLISITLCSATFTLFKILISGRRLSLLEINEVNQPTCSAK